MLTMNKEKMLSKDKLQSAFKLFDEVNNPIKKILSKVFQDQNGFISISEFKNIFCHENKIPNSVWEEMITAIDANNDGKVRLDKI